MADFFRRLQSQVRFADACRVSRILLPALLLASPVTQAWASGCNPIPEALRQFLQRVGWGAPDTYEAALRDLNDDGTPEAVVLLTDPDSCGSGGCTLLVVQQQGRAWHLISKIPIVHPPVLALESLRCGWHSLTRAALARNRSDPCSVQTADMTDLDALKRHIHQAFSDVEPPPPWCLTGSTEGTEPQLLEQEFRAVSDRHWSELPPSFLDRAPDGYGSALSFFSDEAFRFYLPGYLIAAMDGNLQQADPVFHLTHGLTGDAAQPINPRRYGARTFRDAAVYRFAMFTSAQASAIRAFLEWFAASDQALPTDRVQIGQAIASYWAARAA